MWNVVSLISIKNNKILAVKRKKEPYKGLYWLPWWHIEEWETQIEALKREIKEETNQVICNIKYITAIFDNTNNIHLYSADIIWETNYEVEDDWVDHIARITISEFIEWFNKYNVVWREELIYQLGKYTINNSD
jgi:ADP-ribose pyrophosphatase YjhB (NUDIX family)